MKLRKLVTSIGLLVLGGCSFQASCSAGKTLNMKNAAALVEKVVGEQTNLPAKATCPDKVKVEKGGKFECKVVVGGVTATAKLEQTDDKTNVEIKALTGLLLTPALEQQILARLAKETTSKIVVDCGPRVRASTPGETFQCHAKDEVGNVSFEVTKVVPAPTAPEAPAAPATTSRSATPRSRPPTPSGRARCSARPARCRCRAPSATCSGATASPPSCRACRSAGSTTTASPASIRR